MKGKRGWVLLAGCVTLLMAGVIYAWSVLKTPVKAEFGWTDTQTQLCFTLTLCFFCMGGLLSGLISRRVTLRVRRSYRQMDWLKLSDRNSTHDGRGTTVVHCSGDRPFSNRPIQPSVPVAFSGRA